MHERIDGLIGEPAPPLLLSKQQVQVGDELHIRLVGPPGGRATAELVLLTTTPIEVREDGARGGGA